MTDLRHCPFCGHIPHDMREALRPSSIRWREDRGQRHYIGHKDPRDGERCWEMNCLEHEGGCGATITADSREEVVAKWNNRVLWVGRKYPDDGNGDDDAYNRGWNGCLDALAQQPPAEAQGDGKPYCYALAGMREIVTGEVNFLCNRERQTDADIPLYTAPPSVPVAQAQGGGGLPSPLNGDFDCPKAAAARSCPCGFCRALRTPSAPVGVDANELTGVRARLKSGDYDGADVMRAWLAIDKLLALAQQPAPL